MIMADFTSLMILFKTSMTKNTFTTNLKRNIALIAYMSLSPIFFIKFPPSSTPSNIPLDKIFHYIYYFAFASCFLWIDRKTKNYLYLLFLSGILIEGLQQFTSYRSFELVDILSNTLGILSAFFIFKLKSLRD